MRRLFFTIASTICTTAEEGGVVRASGLEVGDDFGAALASALDKGVDAILREQLRERDPAHASVARERHHRVPVAAQYQRLDVAHAHVQLECNEGAVASRVEHSGHADDAARAESRIPSWQRTTSRPSGFDTTMIMASGATLLTSFETWPTMSALVRSRSSRLIPGLRAIPAVTTTMSEPSAGPYSFAPVTRVSKPSMGALSH